MGMEGRINERNFGFLVIDLKWDLRFWNSAMQLCYNAGSCSCSGWGGVKEWENLGFLGIDLKVV